ncbi:MAG TPA: deoxyribose-phosphate aldolase [Rubrobacteraceae bacterium]|nr:deoxyribose-phosphate aldolase [Rubrobacteraceae bacterium]
MSEIVERVTDTRAREPGAIAEALAARKRRPLVGEGGTLFLLAADHPARGIVKVGDNPTAMADRGDYLERMVEALDRPGVDGIMATPDIVDDLVLLGALDEKVVIGSMNRGGLAGAVFELDDRFTGYTAEGIEAANLDGGKMLLRIADDDRDTLPTITACAEAVDALAARGLMAMIEPFASRREEGAVRNVLEPEPMIRAIGISSALGTTSAFTWLKLPVIPEMERMMAATTLPTLLLGGDPGADVERTFEGWREAMKIPQVRGLVAGRSLLYPHHGDVAAAVDAAAAIVAGAKV